MGDRAVTQLEDLPNELFRNVFDHLTIRDLYRAFVGLNGRLDTVAGSIDHVSVKLWSSESADDPAIAFFAPRLVRLMVINDGFDTMNLSCFPSVRSLNLKYPSNNQMRQLIQPNRLRNLEFLSLGTARDASTSSVINQLHRHLFSDGFPLLHSCSLADTPRPIATWSGSPTLHSLILHGPVTSTIYMALLEACPALSDLTLFNFEIYATGERPTTSACHSLRSLSVRTTHWSPYPTIDSLLLHVPKLEQFRIEIIPPVPRINFTQLACIFSERTSRLSRFDCDMMVYKYTIDTDVVHDLHPTFASIKSQYEYGRYHIFT